MIKSGRISFQQQDLETAMTNILIKHKDNLEDGMTALEWLEHFRALMRENEGEPGARNTLHMLLASHQYRQEIYKSYGTPCMEVPLDVAMQALANTRLKHPRDYLTRLFRPIFLQFQYNPDDEPEWEPSWHAVMQKTKLEIGSVCTLLLTQEIVDNQRRESDAKTMSLLGRGV